MATQKQRRRRAKEKRHDYELVEIDAEGNEKVLRATELKAGDDKKKPSQEKGKARRQRGVPQPPSWGRVFKRGLIFAPVFVAVVFLFGGGRVSLLGALLNAALLLAVFVPFSYWIDRFMWRSHQKRQAKAKAKAG